MCICRVDQLIRITVCGKLGVPGTILLYGNTAYGRGEVRWKYFKVKHPRLGMSAVQGEVKKMCIHDLPNIFGHRFVEFLTYDERADALVDKPVTCESRADEDAFIIGKCAKNAGLPHRLTNILMFCVCVWSWMVRTIQGDSDNFDQYTEDLRLYAARAFAWAAIWTETQRRNTGEGIDPPPLHTRTYTHADTHQILHFTGGLTNSQMWDVWGEDASLFSTAIAGRH